MLKYLKTLFRRFNRWCAFNPPGALTSEGWASFDNEFNFKAPIRYWFRNDFKRHFIYPFKWKYEEITYWIKYRTVNRYHIVKTGLEPGYAEVDTVMLHTNFNLLKDFVEVSQAWREYWSVDTTKTWYEQHMPFYRIFVPFRRPDLGVKHLEWAAALDDPSLPVHEQMHEQAKHARETLALYKWWVEDRPARQPVHVRRPETTSGGKWDIFSPAVRLTKEYQIYIADIEKSYKQEERWEKEDDRMLIRLIKIRRGLWT